MQGWFIRLPSKSTVGCTGFDPPPRAVALALSQGSPAPRQFADAGFGCAHPRPESSATVIRGGVGACGPPQITPVLDRDSDSPERATGEKVGPLGPPPIPSILHSGPLPAADLDCVEHAECPRAPNPNSRRGSRLALAADFASAPSRNPGGFREASRIDVREASRVVAEVKAAG